MKKLEILESYLQILVEEEKLTLGRFLSKSGISQQDFFSHFNSIKELEKSFWPTLLESSLKSLKESNDFDSLTSRERILTFFYIWVENLNRIRLYFETFGIRSFLVGRFSTYKWCNCNLNEIFDISESKFKIERKVYSLALHKLLFAITLHWYNDSSSEKEVTDGLIEKSVNLMVSMGELSLVSNSIDIVRTVIR